MLLEKLTEVQRNQGPRERTEVFEDSGVIQVAYRFESLLPVGAHTPVGHLLDVGLTLSVLLLLLNGYQSSL